MNNIPIKSSEEVILEYFGILFDKDFFDYDKMESLLDDNFEQHSDGHLRTREVILKHFEGHKQMKQTSTIDFVTIIAKKENIFAHYTITKPKPRGGSTKWDVLAKFIVRNNKLVYSEQLSEIANTENADS